MISNRRPIGVYGVDRNFDGTLLSDTQSVLHSLADVSRDISVFLETRLRGTNVRSSKIATRLILSYHHVSRVQHVCLF